MADQTTPPVVNPDNLNEAGDVITEEIFITAANGNNYDIRNFCIGVTLFEDIFSNVMMGNAVLQDSANLIGKIPLQGAEYITFTYKTPSFTEKISKTFYINKIGDRFFSANDRQAGYVLSFISIEGYLDNTLSISKKYSGTTDSIVRKTFNEYLRTPRHIKKKELTSVFPLISTFQIMGSSATIVVPYWNPFKVINWAASRSFGSAAEAPNFVFYESNKGFYFTSIEQLASKQRESKQLFAEYIYSPSGNMIQGNPKSKFTYTKPELLEQYSSVRSMKPFNMVDTLKAQDHGYHTSKLISFDVTLKRPEEHVFDYYDQFKSFKHFEEENHPTFSQSTFRNPDANRVVLTKYHKIHNDAKDPLFQKWALQRNSLMYDLSNLKIEIEVPGRTDIEVGRLVNFLYPKNIDKNANDLLEDTLDPYMSGIYMITAIRHEFVLNKHTMYIELAKDSFKRELK